MREIEATREHGALTLKRHVSTCAILSNRDGVILEFAMGLERDNVTLWHIAADMADRAGKVALSDHIRAALRNANRHAP